MTAWCERLKPEHGYGGVTVLASPRLSVAQTHGAAAYGMARQFAGLELDDPTTHVGYLKDGIKGGSWLTVLSTPWIENLGGLARLDESLGQDFLLRDYPGGVLIKAVAAPEMRIENPEHVLALQRRLARVLRPIRTRVHSGFHGLGLTREQSEAWLARFDGA